MSLLEKEIEKLYWQIGEIALELNVRPCTIRFWLDEFGIEVKRSRKGDRKFNREERDQVKEIHRLLKIEGYTVQGAKRQLNPHHEEIETLLNATP